MAPTTNAQNTQLEMEPAFPHLPGITALEPNVHQVSSAKPFSVAVPARARTLNRWIKRTFDIGIAVPLLLLLTPGLLFAAICLWIKEGSPVFFLSMRHIGLRRAVPVIKFRTMVRDAGSAKYRLAERFMHDGYLNVPADCEVYTGTGRILERFQIVEFPQLINVLVHGMSLVGNRPLPKENLDLLAQFPAWECRFDSPAGITGISQLVGKFGLTPVQRLKLESLYGRVYLSGNIIKCDIIIIWLTVMRVVLQNKGIPFARAVEILQSCLPQRTKNEDFGDRCVVDHR
jgi:lipopolysaccharide/colanic/teichoic acid biosynthesis glycosyltransferase